MNHASNSSTHSIEATELCAIVARMDALSQNGFTAIAAIARRALAGLESASGTPASTVALVATLDSIWQKAEFFGNEVNAVAEVAGLNYVSTH